ncbi:hypothetical protein ABS71_15090 [bacterium SCN 62-11]|nr:MAG: hypothetical protein ABS71_15090 [bacterium SCN 62-11]
MPLGISRSQFKGVVVYFHGTTFSKSQVPSEYDGNGETELMAEVFAPQGYVVVMPDYVGQGVDWETVHPHVLYPKVSAQTATDMLTAAAPTRYGLTSISRSIPAEGAYSTSQVTFDYLFTDVSKSDGNPFNIQSQSIVNAVKAILSADAFCPMPLTQWALSSKRFSTQLLCDERYLSGPSIRVQCE